MMVLTTTFWKDNFVYDPLSSKPRSLRLIKLLAPVRSFFPPFGEIVRFQIIEGSLEDIEPFDALSYTWGDTTSPPNRPVIVETPEGQLILRIYKPLELALLSLSRKQQGTSNRPLFVDQICINQSKKDEKASQVKLMGDIYTRCERVIVWLGPGTRRSDNLFHFTLNVCKEGILSRVMGPNVGHFLQVFDAVVDSNIEVDNEAVREDRNDILWLIRRYGARYPLHGAVDVLGRPWFNRLWIIQEVCLAPNVIYWLHNVKPKVSKKEVRLRNQILTLNSAFIRIFQQRKALHMNGTKMSLYELVLKYSVHGDNIKVGVGLPEDRIFGLLGLARDEETKRNTEVRYDGRRNVYTRLAALAVKQDLDVLLFSQKTETKIELPSWVPDWSATHLRIPNGYIGLGTPVFSAGGNTVNEMPVTNVAKGLLTVQGYLIDHINRTGTYGLQRDESGGTDIEHVDFLLAAQFFDEINEFLELAGKIENSRFEYASNQHLRDTAAMHLADGGLSSRRFPDLFDPATAQAMIEKIHRHIDYLGHVMLKSEITRRSYSITRIIQTIGIAPYYWVPASEVDVLRLCAKDPVRAARMWIKGVRDFVTDMISVVCASSAVQLTAWALRMRRRHFAKVDLSGPTRGLYGRVGVDRTLVHSREWEEYTSNLYKMVGRRLFLTQRGYLGLGPENMEEGDVVVVLVGSSVPHVLRPRRDSPTPSEGHGATSSSQSHIADETESLNLHKYWSYVGETYCEGIMDGEILTERGVGEVTQFRIL